MGLQGGINGSRLICLQEEVFKDLGLSVDEYLKVASLMWKMKLSPRPQWPLPSCQSHTSDTSQNKKTTLTVAALSALSKKCPKVRGQPRLARSKYKGFEFLDTAKKRERDSAILGHRIKRKRKG